MYQIEYHNIVDEWLGHRVALGALFSPAPSPSLTGVQKSTIINMSSAHQTNGESAARKSMTKTFWRNHPSLLKLQAFEQWGSVLFRAIWSVHQHLPRSLEDAFQLLLHPRSHSRYLRDSYSAWPQCVVANTWQTPKQTWLPSQHLEKVSHHRGLHETIAS